MSVSAHDREGRERLLRYCARPPLSREQLLERHADAPTPQRACGWPEALDRFAENIPDVIIALTAYASIADRTRALMERFQNQVSKPSEPEELVAAVAALAGKFNRP